MHLKYFILLVFLSIFERSNAQSVKEQFPNAVTIRIFNPLKTERESVLVVVSRLQLNKLHKDFNPKAFVVLDGEAEVPSQYNANEHVDNGVVFVLDKMRALESRTLTIRYHPTATIPKNYKKRTQVELSTKTGGQWQAREYVGGKFENVSYLRVPPEHKDHSWFIRYEGPGWESDKVGYRFYLDQRNAVDVFGKKVEDVVLQQVGLDGFDSYHEMQPWGMDVMKVGKSLGLGSIGYFQGDSITRVDKTDSVACRIVENGNVYSSLVTNYWGWQTGTNKIDLSSKISIHAGTRLTHQSLSVSEDTENISTGIVKDEAASLITAKGDKSKFGYLATYGKQSLNKDELGLAVFFNANDLQAITSDRHSHVIKLIAKEGKVDYYFLAAWVQEPGGIKDQKEFERYVKQVAVGLANPVRVKILK